MHLHQYARTSVLEVQDGKVPLLIRAAPDDFKTQLTDYSVSIQQSESQLAPDSLPQHVHMIALDLGAEVTVEPPKFDVLILRRLWNFLGSIEATEILLGNIKLLTTLGATILLEAQLPSAQITIELALRFGFSIICEVKDGDIVLLLFRATPIITNGIQKESPREIFIIEPDDMSASLSTFSSEISRKLENHSINCAILRWSKEILDMVRGKRCIILVELEKPLLENLGADDFIILQTLLSASSSLTWITAINGPGSNIITGLLRTIRNEIPESLHRVLHLSSKTPLADAACLLSRVIISDSEEHEFKEAGGLLCIPRIYQDTKLDTRLCHLITEKIESMSIEDSTPPLRLSIAKAGQLGSLYFEPDDRASLPLGEHEIEIATKASGMK